MINIEVKKYVDTSVLCWLATSSKDNIPNVSPKEVFRYFKNKVIIIANIASPQTIKNIKENPNVCISFIDILVQKGLQIKGLATIVKKESEQYKAMEIELLKITQGKFPFSSITKINIETIKPIIAPKYILYPETTEKEQIESSIKAYKLSK